MVGAERIGYARFGARDPGVLRRLGVVISWGALVVLVPLPSGATDVCRLSGRALNAEVEKGAAEIAKAYATTTSHLSLSGGPCNWTCSSGRISTPLIKVFGFLQYNCSSTTAPLGTRRPTGRDTDSEMGLSITDAEYQAATDKILSSGSRGVDDVMRVPSAVVDASQDGDVKKLTDAGEKSPGAG